MVVDTNGENSKVTLNVHIYYARKTVNLLIIFNDINHFFNWNHIDTHGKNIS